MRKKNSKEVFERRGVEADDIPRYQFTDLYVLMYCTIYSAVQYESMINPNQGRRRRPFLWYE